MKYNKLGVSNIFYRQDYSNSENNSFIKLEDGKLSEVQGVLVPVFVIGSTKGGYDTRGFEKMFAKNDMWQTKFSFKDNVLKFNKLCQYDIDNDSKVVRHYSYTEWLNIDIEFFDEYSRSFEPKDFYFIELKTELGWAGSYDRDHVVFHPLSIGLPYIGKKLS